MRSFTQVWILGITLLASTGCSKERCGSYTSSTAWRARSCPDGSDYEVRCNEANARYTCECVRDETVVGSFERTAPLPATFDEASVEIINRACRWRIPAAPE
ncbi:MAG: hypothetical protein AAGE52_31245 [Myxococcota bacterium]